MHRFDALALLAAALLACSGQRTSDEQETAAEPACNQATEPIRSGGLSVLLPGSASDALDIEVDGGLRASLKLVGARAIGATESEHGRRYRGALGVGFDLEWQLGEEGLRDRLSLPHAPPGGRISYEIALLDGFAGIRVAGGTVELLDAAGTPKLRIAGAEAVGADGQRFELGLEVLGCEADRTLAMPWGRRPVAPGAASCQIVVELPEALRYPAVYDPLWTATGNMALARNDQAVALLNDGRVLAVGGLSNGMRREVEMFDPATSTWSMLPAASWLANGGLEFSLTTLDDGRALMTGGLYNLNGTTRLAIAQTFSPTTLLWSPQPDMSSIRSAHSATKLPDGRVLVVGGRIDTNTSLTSGEIFDPGSDSWSAVPAMQTPRYGHSATLVAGRVLVAGGFGPGFTPTATAEIFDPGIGNWSNLPAMNTSRAYHAAAQLGSNRVLVGGGMEGYQNGAALLVQQNEVFDVTTLSWSTAGSSSIGVAPGAARTGSGGVLLAGGCSDADSTYCDAPFDQASYFDPISAQPADAGTLMPGRGKHTMVSLADGRVLASGGQTQLTALAGSQVFALQPPGQPCNLPFECASSQCVDGVCCDGACNGLCEACKTSLTGASDGLCAPISDGTDPEGECSDDGAASCGQNGLCLAGACDSYAAAPCQALPCVEDQECSSGHCADGICCDTACGGLCQTCVGALKTDGIDGQCGPVIAGNDPDFDCHQVSEMTCERSTCGGASSCVSLAPLCGGFSCDEAGCLTACTDDTHCADGNVCIDGVCEPASKLCTEGHLALARSGAISDCSPFGCAADGTCNTACVSVGDCHSPNVCHRGECIPPPATTGGDTGCACRSAPEPGGAPARLAWWFLVAALLRRRLRGRS